MHAYFRTFISKQHSAVRVDDHLVPLPPPFQQSMAFFFELQNFDDKPPMFYTINTIDGVIS